MMKQELAKYFPALALRLRIQGHGERELITLATARRTLS
jgi:hypothetical protein